MSAYVAKWAYLPVVKLETPINPKDVLLHFSMYDSKTAREISLTRSNAGATNTDKLEEKFIPDSHGDSRPSVHFYHWATIQLETTVCQVMTVNFQPSSSKFN